MKINDKMLKQAGVLEKRCSGYLKKVTANDLKSRKNP